MTKYLKLAEQLTKETVDEVKYSFKEIEEILGFSLSQPAKSNRSFWGNDKTHSHAKYGWLSNLWKVISVDIENQTVVFQRIKGHKIHTEPLFSWNDIPGNDNKRLIGSLKKSFHIEWAENASIEKIDEGRTIRLFFENNFLSLKLNDDKNNVNLKIDDDRTYEFIAKIENGKINIYYMEISTAAEFENEAARAMSDYYGKDLFAGIISGHPKKLFDMVSEDRQIVGEAKYLSTVNEKSIPPAKLCIISEQVWFLEKVDAKIRFLVFGNDRRVPEIWLARYGKLSKFVDFFYYGRNMDKPIKLNNI